MSVDVLAPSSEGRGVVGGWEGEWLVHVDGPVQVFGLISEDGEQVVDKFGVVDGQKVFDFDGKEVEAVGQVGYVAKTARVHRYSKL